MSNNVASCRYLYADTVCGSETWEPEVTNCSRVCTADSTRYSKLLYLMKVTPDQKVLNRPLLSLRLSVCVCVCVRGGGVLSLTHSTQQFSVHLSTGRQDSPMKPKMSLMVGTKMTSMLLKAKMAAAISMWRVQLNSRPLNSRVVMEERIWDMTQS